MGVFGQKKYKRCGRVIDESDFMNWGKIFCSEGCKRQFQLNEKQTELTQKQSQLADRAVKDSHNNQREIERLRIENINRKRVYQIVNEIRRYYSQATTLDECNIITNSSEFSEVLRGYTQFATDADLHEEYYQLVLEFYEELRIRVS